jgi:hypothetical protein
LDRLFENFGKIGRLGRQTRCLLRIEAVCEAAAVDVKSFENLKDESSGDAPIESPANDVEVFLSRFESVEDAVEEEVLVLKLMLEEPEVAAV